MNEETEGHAAHAWALRGTTVCDIGLNVASASEVAARAAALGDAPFRQAPGPGELDIPAIRGLSGSLLHFLDAKSCLDDVWQVEFEPVGEALGKDAGLIRVDHLAQTMRFDEMMSWTLFYTSLFEMTKSPMVDVIDPDGLVRSQVVEAPDGALRITLNGAESHRTLAGRLLSETFGAPLQHIALATDDIFATTARLSDLGFETLEISANYYDDLAARFDIAPDLLERMRAAHILYDRDADGEFFQVYSGGFIGGMFIEIVERRGGYRGYGAPNAPFRIAAQKRRLWTKGVPSA